MDILQMMQLRIHGCYVYKYMGITRIYTYTKLTYNLTCFGPHTYEVCKLTHRLTYTHVYLVGNEIFNYLDENTTLTLKSNILRSLLTSACMNTH